MNFKIIEIKLLTVLLLFSCTVKSQTFEGEISYRFESKMDSLSIVDTIIYTFQDNFIRVNSKKYKDEYQIRDYEKSLFYHVDMQDRMVVVEELDYDTTAMKSLSKSCPFIGYNLSDTIFNNSVHKFLRVEYKCGFESFIFNDENPILQINRNYLAKRNVIELMHDEVTNIISGRIILKYQFCLGNKLYLNGEVIEVESKKIESKTFKLPFKQYCWSKEKGKFVKYTKRST